MMKGYSNLLISVIVPICNVEKYVEKCITSIMRQTYENIEIILVDDGSEDSSSGICDKYAEQDKRIKVIHKENGGLVSARKAGAKVASGQYIINVDGDDWIEPDRFWNLAVEIAKNESDMVGMIGYVREYGKDCDITVVEGKEAVYIGEEIISDWLINVVDTRRFYLQRIPFSQWCWAVRKEIYVEVQLGIEDKINTFEDVLCMTACMLKAQKISCIIDKGYHYVQRSTSIIRSAGLNIDIMKNWYISYRQLFYDYGLAKSHNHLLKYLTAFYLLSSDCEPLVRGISDYLFPYPTVKRGSRIVLYGAGNFGKKLAKALLKCSNDFEIVMWTDKNSDRTIEGHYISNMRAIAEMQYDYVVVAILFAKMADEARQELISMGVSEEKIALIDISAIDNEALLPKYGIKCEELE